MNSKILLATTAMILTSNITLAENVHHQHHNAHSNHGYEPLNIASTHNHSKGEWMLSYKYMHMEMDGMRKGTKSVDRSAIYSANYMVSPLSMETDMHMVGAMYGLGNDFTFMGMIPYLEKSMDLRTMAGVEFTTKSKGFGDLKLSFIDNLNRFKLNNWSATYTLSVPTGSIEKTDSTPMATDTRLAYPMQLGSGTVDFTPAVTYKKNCHGISFGAQAYGTFRMNDNSEDYRLGNIFGLNAWVGKNFTEEFSAGITLNAAHESEIHGTDGNLNAMMSPTANTANTGYEKATLGFDVSYKPKSLKGLEIAGDYTAPVYQDVNGYQMDRDHMITFAVRKTF